MTGYKIAALAVAMILIAIVSAVMHERDIALACAKDGASGLAGWTIDIKCSVQGKTAKP